MLIKFSNLIPEFLIFMRCSIKNLFVIYKLRISMTEATHSTTIYMLPQTSLDIDKIKPTVNKFARGMQDKGYFGYLAVDCYCYLRKQEEILMVLLLNVFPYYSYCQNYIDWMEFAIGGRYK